MQHPDEGQGQRPMTKEDRYPATVWSRYREEGVPVLVLLGLVAAVAEQLLGVDWAKAFGLGLAALAVLAVVPTLALEYRADMAYDRAHPADEGFMAEEVSK